LWLSIRTSGILSVIPVVLAQVDITLPAEERNRMTTLVSQLRHRLQEGLATPENTEKLRNILGGQIENLDRDEMVVGAWRKLLSGDEKALKDFNDHLAAAQAAPPQWLVGDMMKSLEAAVPVGKNVGVVYLGVTRKDLYREDLNFMFGQGQPGAGVISYLRFRAAFNESTPNRTRLKKRLVNQCLSTIGFTFGVERCTSPVCPRAYPNSLQEHDAKGETLCPDCRKRFDEEFAKIRQAGSHP